MKVGYVRVSKEEQHKDLQVNALKAAGCERIYEDTKSGAVFVREGLDECLTYLRAGDVLTVWKLDRLGRSVADLIRIVNELEVLGIDFCCLTQQIDTSTPGGKLTFHLFAALAQYERELLIERTNAGLAAARAKGVHLGRRGLSEEQVNIARYLYSQGKGVPEIAKTIKASRSTVYRYLTIRGRGDR